MHTYERDLDPQASDSLAKIAARVRRGAKVLDVGTGSGAMGRYLSRALGCTVDGVTVNADEAALAREAYRRLEVADLEACLPSSLFGSERYDAIICADVLEHVRNAGAVLTDLRRLLAPGGRVLLSLPNASYAGVLAQLCAGRFARTREGLLDATHVQFFDRRGVEQLVLGAGLRIAASDDVVRGIEQTEFRRIDWSLLPKPVWAYVCAQPDAAVYQFIAELAPADEVPAQPAPLPGYPEITLAPHFFAQLYVDTGDGFHEEASQVVWARADAGPQTLAFALDDAAAQARAIRLDPADRACVFGLEGLSAHAADGAVLWSWAGEPAAGVSLHQLERLPAATGVILRSHGADPWIQLELGPGGRSLRGAATLSVRLSPPQAADQGAQADQGRRLLEAFDALAHQGRRQQEEIRQLRHQIDALTHSTSWRVTAGLRWLAARLKGAAH
jgi:ubiquinone/menaquinone biosynthesis C-methylase UbiE